VNSNDDPFIRSLAALKGMLGIDSNSRPAGILGSPQRGAHMSNEHLSDMEQKLDEARTTVNEERSMRQSLETALEQLTANRKHLNAQVERANQVNASLTAEIQSLKSQPTSGIVQDDKLENEIVKLTKEKDDAVAACHAVEQKLAAAEQMAQDLNDKLKAKTEDEQQAMESLQAMNANLQKALETSEKQKDKLSKEVGLKVTFSLNAIVL